MAAFPSGVTIMTTVDRDGQPWGFAASSFCSLSLDPPLVLVCLARTAQCHPVFDESDEWAIQVVNPRHLDLVAKFATKGADKFGGREFVHNDHGVPVLPDASVVLQCSAHARHEGGDHTILVARVNRVDLSETAPVLYFQRDFHRLADSMPLTG